MDARPESHAAATGPPATEIMLAPPAAYLPAVGARPPALSSTPDLSDLMKALLRRWPSAVGLGLLAGAVIGSIVWIVVPPAKYTTRAILQISTYHPRIIFETAEQRSDSRTYQRTQEALIRSRLVLGAASLHPSLAGLKTLKGEIDPPEWLEKNLQIGFPGGSEILQIGLSGDHPKELADIVNSVVNSYLDVVKSQEKVNQELRFTKLDKLYASYQDMLAKRRKQVRGLAEKTGTDDRETMALRQQLELEELTLLRRKLLELRDTIRGAESEVAVLSARARGSARHPVSELLVARLIEDDGQIREMREGLARLDQQIVGVDRIARDGAGEQRRVKAALEKKLAARAAALTPRIREELKERAAGEARAELARAEEQLTILRDHEAQLDREIARHSAASQAFNHSILDLKAESDEFRILDDVAKKVGTEKEALEVEIQAVPRIQVLQRADAPRTKDEMKRVKAAGAAGLAGFFVGLVGMSFWEYRARRITTVDEVSIGLGLRVVGALPDLSARPRLLQSGGLAAQRRRTSLLVDSIDAARAVLLHAMRNESVRVVMITSASKGEGKTSLACHMAASMARAGRQTVLVDCDLRESSVNRIFDAAPGAGICELLRGEAKLEDALTPAEVGGLWLMTAGRCDDAALRMIARDGLRGTFEALKSSFDLVIVDSAPVLPVAESLLIAQQSDVVILSILRGVSRTPNVYAASERLAMLGVRVLGAVVAGTTDLPYSDEYNHANRGQPTAKA